MKAIMFFFFCSLSLSLSLFFPKKREGKRWETLTDLENFCLHLLICFVAFFFFLTSLLPEFLLFWAQAVISWIPLLALFEDVSDVSFSPVFMHFFQLPQASKDKIEWPCNHLCSSLSTCGLIPSWPMDL